MSRGTAAGKKKLIIWIVVGVFIAAVIGVSAYLMYAFLPRSMDIDWDSIEIGCEISFNKYFYKPVELRSLEENEADIIALDQESQGFIRDLLAAK